ncbi:MAG TPA: GNAT family N-acetyltransferase, partial [Actinomycetota bacterium]|nr:GNAT family N-acetyltransferase [Actinomycetota bacterium]
EQDGARGVVAMRRVEAIGFLAGVTSTDTVRGRTAWSGIGSHASDEPESYAAMYAALAEGWVGMGFLEHYVVVTPAEDVMQTWFHLGFGMEQVHALTATAGVPEPHPERGLSIRRAARDDLDAVRPLVSVIGEYQATSPVFAAHLPEFAAEYERGHADLLADERVGYFVAERDGRVVAFVAMIPAESGDADLHVPDRCVELSVAATLPEHRGSGVMTALVQQALAWARADGFETCLTDWRSTNPLSSAFWPRFGFEPAAYRLHRTIDARASKSVR